MVNIDEVVEKYFNFLVIDFGFTKVSPYGYSRENHFDYIKENLIVKIVYDGDYWVSILKSKKTEVGLISEKKRTTDYDFRFFKRYDLRQLDLDKKIYNLVNVQMIKEKELQYYSDLLSQNPEILNGDVSKLTLRYVIIKKKWL